MPRPLAFAALLSVQLGVLSGCSPALDLGSNDAGLPYDADCKPGTYTGSYACVALADSQFQLSGSGPIAVTLNPSGALTLALPLDASLSSVSSALTSNSRLSGVLDCSTRKLVGAVSDVVLSSPTFNATVNGTGVLDAIYDGDASPPALVEGTLTPPASLSATCTWTATLE